MSTHHLPPPPPVSSLVGALATTLMCVCSFAGPLNPPVGAVAPTAKQLSEVEPRIAINATNTLGDADSLYKITQPGSYYLTGNITGVAGKYGIEIAASGVTLDLNGFDLAGVPGMGAFDGVGVTTGGLTSIAVLNGSVRGWGDDGVDLGTATTGNCRVEGVRAYGNGGTGISAGLSTTVTNCTATSNTGIGISAGQGSRVTNCAAASNSNGGIVIGFACGVADCTVSSNAVNGILTGEGCNIAGCTATSNTGNGINAANGCSIVACTTRSNGLDGIRVASNSSVLGNLCNFSGLGGDGAGIHATGSDNRIEGNNCTNADRGVDVDFTGNIIIRNTCSGNTTNWDVVAGNALAPITAASTNAAPVVGNTYTGSLGSTDPNANFTY